MSLYQRIFELGGEVYLFENNQGTNFSREYLHRIIKREGKKILNKDIHPHTFRHTFVVYARKKGMSLKAIANWLGHSSVKITIDMYDHDELKPDDIEYLFNGFLKNN